MKITQEQINLLKNLMIKSAREGNLATAGIVLENGKVNGTLRVRNSGGSG